MSVWLSKNIVKNLSYTEVMKNLRRHYNLQVSYEDVKFAASDVIQEILCQMLLLVKYFERKITDNQSDNFLRMLTKNDLPFS